MKVAGRNGSSSPAPGTIGAKSASPAPAATAVSQGHGQGRQAGTSPGVASPAAGPGTGLPPPPARPTSAGLAPTSAAAGSVSPGSTANGLPANSSVSPRPPSTLLPPAAASSVRAAPVHQQSSVPAVSDNAQPSASPAGNPLKTPPAAGSGPSSSQPGMALQGAGNTATNAIASGLGGPPAASQAGSTAPSVPIATPAVGGALPQAPVLHSSAPMSHSGPALQINNARIAAPAVAPPPATSVIAGSDMSNKRKLEDVDDGPEARYMGSDVAVAEGEAKKAKLDV